jgi:hypothetical protein
MDGSVEVAMGYVFAKLAATTKHAVYVGTREIALAAKCSKSTARKALRIIGSMPSYKVTQRGNGRNRRYVVWEVT